MGTCCRAASASNWRRPGCRCRWPDVQVKVLPDDVPTADEVAVFSQKAHMKRPERDVANAVAVAVYGLEQHEAPAPDGGPKQEGIQVPPNGDDQLDDVLEVADGVCQLGRGVIDHELVPGDLGLLRGFFRGGLKLANWLAYLLTYALTHLLPYLLIYLLTH